MKKIIIPVIFAGFLWYLTFVVRPYNFWLMMSFNTLVLSLIAFIFGKPLFYKRASFKDFMIGFLSAIFLYSLFFVGNKFLGLFIDNKSELLNSIYANRGGYSKLIVGALLVFPIGFGEEIFWRGYVQKKAGFWLALFAYVAIHVPTWNPVLILAAAVCGFYWGLLYRYTGNLWIVVFSHIVWDPIIFVIRPIL